MDTNIVSNAGSGITTNLNRFAPIQNSVVALNTTTTAGQNPMPFGGTIKNFYVKIDTAPGAGITRTYTVYKNGVATGVVCTMSDAAVTANDLVNTVDFVAGDTFSFHTSASAVTANTGGMRWSVMMTATASRSVILSTTDTSAPNGAASYTPAQGDGNDLTTAAVEAYCPTAGTIKNLYLVSNAAPGAGTSYEVELVKNGTPTGLKATISGTGTTGNETSTSVTVAQGDKLYYSITPAGTPTARAIMMGVEFNPTVNGESVHMFGNGGNMSTSAVRFSPVTSAQGLVNSSEVLRNGISQAVSLRKMYLATSVAPGDAKSYQAQVQIDGVAGNPSATVTGAATTTAADNVNTGTVVAGNTLAFKYTPAGTPTAAAMKCSVVSFIQPTSTFTPRVMMFS